MKFELAKLRVGNILIKDREAEDGRWQASRMPPSPVARSSALGTFQLSRKPQLSSFDFQHTASGTLHITPTLPPATKMREMLTLHTAQH